MTPSAALNKTVDCRRVSCAIVSRNDHTRTGDRSQDVVIPVTFAADAPVALPAPAPATVPLPAPTAAPDTTTTTVPETTASTEPPTSETTTAVGADSGDTAELLVAPVASDGGSSSGGAAVAVLAVVVVVLLLVGAGGLVWRAVRRRSGPSAT
jgi:cobalamin biosynthesis Mg chelatase CobN